MAETTGGIHNALRLIGPAAIMTAGIMGAGSTTALLLSGTYFGYTLLWVVFVTAPIVVVCQDTASRIGTLAGGKGMMTIIREETHPAVVWCMLIPLVLVAILGNCGQLSAMYDSVVTAMNDVAGAGLSRGDLTVKIATFIPLAVFTFLSVLFGGYKGVERIMKFLLFVIALSFLIVAADAFTHPEELRRMLDGFTFSIPANATTLIDGKEVARSGMGYLAAIAGGAVAATAILSYPYFTTEGGHQKKDLSTASWNAFWTFGILFGTYSVVLLVAGAYRLHPLPDHLQIQDSARAGSVLSGLLGTVGTTAFAVGLFSCGYSTLIVVAQLISYFVLDALKMEWRFNLRNRWFLMVFAAMIVLPTAISIFWKYPAMLRVVIPMIVSTAITPFAIVLLLILINNRRIAGDQRAGIGRNLLLTYSLALCLWIGVRSFLKFLDEARQAFLF